jgi:predicted transcriptional regulator
MPTNLPPSLLRTPVSTIMRKTVAVAEKSMTLVEVAKLLVERAVGGVPVVDAGRPIGVVSKSDLVAAMARDELDATAFDVMSTPPLTLPKDAPVAQAAAMMAHEGHHRVLIVSEAGELAGIVSTIDILRLIAIEDGYVVPSHTRAQRPQS